MARYHAFTARQAREDNAKPAEEWTRDKFQCFIKKEPQLDKLTTGELQALFLKYYGRYDNRTYFKRVHGIHAWLKQDNRPIIALALDKDLWQPAIDGDKQAVKAYYREADKLKKAAETIHSHWIHVSAPQF